MNRYDAPQIAPSRRRITQSVVFMARRLSRE
jgi:hypothetical protein